MGEIIHYVHHNVNVAVQKDLRGRHKEHCLCYQDCLMFRPDEPGNCPVAERVFATCVDEGIVTPVWECPTYVKAK